MSVLVLLLTTLLPVLPQTPAAAAAPEAAANTSGEMKTLDIVQRRIVEEDFHASRSVRLVADRPGVALDAGVALGARRIDVTLHNVKGSYRFRARLAALHNRVRVLPDPEEGPPSTLNR
jgi:hypothetical protein